MTKLKRIIITLAILFAALQILVEISDAEITTELSDKLSSVDKTEYVKILIDFNNPNSALKNSPELAKLNDPDERYRMMNRQLHRQADINKNSVDATIESLISQDKIRNYKIYWIAGMASAEAREDGVIVLSGNPAIKSVDLDYPVTCMDPVTTENAPMLETGVQPGIEAIGAKIAWQRGYTGAGRIVCNIDTGVDGYHPALMAKFRGNNGYPASQCWFDPYTQTNYPIDNGGHGTHTMGIMVGSDGADTIGVAPGATWIAAAPVDRGGNIDRTISDMIASFQWAADPDGNPETVNDRPDVVNNSWGIPRGVRPECDPTFWSVIDNCEAMGIVCVFAAGNEGPGSQTLRSPADRASSPTNTFAVGAINGSDPNFPIANFSSRGPSGCDGLIIKPQVVAPGVSIRSSIPDSSYSYSSGTSMAAPHVAGAVAILRQARPDATVEEIKYALMESARDLGASGPDFDYGYGMINIPAALNILLGITAANDDNDNSSPLPDQPILYGNYPNPFNASTTIRFALPSRSFVNLAIYNIVGQKVATIFDGMADSGEHNIRWDGIDENGKAVSSGVYFYRLESSGKSASRRMMMVK